MALWWRRGVGPSGFSIFRQPKALLGLNSPRLRLRSAISVENLLWAARAATPLSPSTDCVRMCVWVCMWVGATPLCGKNSLAGWAWTKCFERYPHFWGFPFSIFGTELGHSMYSIYHGWKTIHFSCSHLCCSPPNTTYIFWILFNVGPINNSINHNWDGIMPTPPAAVSQSGKKSISVSVFWPNLQCLFFGFFIFFFFCERSVGRRGSVFYMCWVSMLCVYLFCCPFLAILVHLNICQISEKVASAPGLRVLRHAPHPASSCLFWPISLAFGQLCWFILVVVCWHDPFVAFVNPNSNRMHKSETKHTPQKATEFRSNN